MLFYRFGASFSRQVYPIMVQLPLIIFLILAYKCTLLNSVVSVLTAYLCCQIPLWCGLFFSLFSSNKILYTVIYVISALLTFYILYHYITNLTHYFMQQTRKNALLLAIVPLCYYIFDYATTVYTDLLYSQNELAVQFMPSVCCFFLLCICHLLLLATCITWRGKASGWFIKSAVRARCYKSGQYAYYANADYDLPAWFASSLRLSVSLSFYRWFKEDNRLS